MRIRLRLPTGQAQLNVEEGTTVSMLKTLIEAQSSIPAARQKLLVGYPPAAMPEGHACADGEVVIVRDEAPELPASAQAPPPPAAREPALTDGVAVRKVIPADNNCLFAALIHALRLPLSPQALRETVKRSVLEDPAEWNEGMLGLPPDKYCEWITAKDHWGGEIELRILSRQLRVQVAVLDVVSQQLLRYGEEERFDQMVCLLYDGIHYDAILLLPAPGAPEEFGTSCFAPGDAQVLRLARALQAEAHAARAFTDTAKFTLRCLVCSAGLVGEKGAQEHAKATGHINFSEY